MGLFELEKSYCASIIAQPKMLKNHYNNVSEALKSNCGDKEISNALLERMRTFYIAEEGMKNFLNYKTSQPAAYFFEQTVLFYTKAYIETKFPGFKVVSQERIKVKGKTMQPDILVKGTNNNNIAAIECKTQLGWNRKSWEQDFKSRKEKFEEVNSKGKMFLLVLTSKNWENKEGFTKFKNSKEYGKRYFCLTKQWPSELPEKSEEIKDEVLTPFEHLLDELMQLPPKPTPHSKIHRN